MADYFSEAISTGQPILPPKPQGSGEAPAEAGDVTPQSGFKGLAVRSGGDRVFLIKNGQRAWVTNPEALEKAGFTFADVQEIDQVSLDVFPEGEPIRG